MAKLQQKRRLKNLINSKVVCGLLLLLCVPLLISVRERFKVEREMAARLHGFEQEKVELEDRKQTLEERVKYLKDDRGIEAEIRRHFDVAKTGEQVVIILDNDESESDRATSTTEKSAPWYMFWR